MAAQQDTGARRIWTTPRQRMALVAGILSIGIAVYWIGFRPSVPCVRCSNSNFSSIGCGIEGVTGIGWLDRLVDTVAGGHTYHWVGHRMLHPSNNCPYCHGTGAITPLRSWINTKNGESRTMSDESQ